MAQQAQDRPVKDKLLKQVQALEAADRTKVIKTRERQAKIRPEFVGHTFAVFTGEGFTNVHIDQEMVGRTFGKVAPRTAPTARSRYISVPERKMRRVAELIKGMPVEKALNILNFTPKIAAVHIARTLKAAVANKLSTEGTSHLNPEDLFVARVTVEAGPTAKRIQFQSMGRVYRIRKRYCHLNVFLGERAGAGVEPIVKGAKGQDEGEAATGATPTKGAGKKTAPAKPKKSLGKRLGGQIQKTRKTKVAAKPKAPKAAKTTKGRKSDA
jgi:large subunit ribosomal protein L22